MPSAADKLALPPVPSTIFEVAHHFKAPTTGRTRLLRSLISLLTKRASTRAFVKVPKPKTLTVQIMTACQRCYRAKEALSDSPS